MQCQEVCRELEAYLSGELSRQQATAIDAHLKQCPACSKERREHEAFVQLLGTTLKAKMEAQVPPHIERRLLAALAQERSSSRYWRRRGSRAGLLQGFGAAAVFLFAVILSQRAPLAPPEEPAPGFMAAADAAPVRHTMVGESAEGLIQLATMLSDRSLRSEQAAIPVEPEVEPEVQLVYVEVEVPVEVVVEREVPPSRGPSNPSDLDEKEERDEVEVPEGEGEASSSSSLAEEAQPPQEPPAWVAEQAAEVEKVEYGNGWVRVSFALPGWPANQPSPAVDLGNSWGAPVAPNTLEWQMTDKGRLQGKAYFILPGRASHLQLQLSLPDRELILPLPQP